MVKRVQQVIGGRGRFASMPTRVIRATTRAFRRGARSAGIELFEQPCAAGDWDARLAVARIAPVPMMLDESIYGLDDIRRAADLNAARYIKVKLMKLGGLDRLAAAIDTIRDCGMEPVLGNGVACEIGCWMEACIAARPHQQCRRNERVPEAGCAAAKEILSSFATARCNCRRATRRGSITPASRRSWSIRCRALPAFRKRKENARGSRGALDIPLA